MNLFKLIIVTLIVSLSMTLYADTTSVGDNSPIISGTKGNVTIEYQSLGMSLEVHESLLRKEIEKVENELKKIGDEKTNALIDKLSLLRKKLDAVLEEKNRLAKMVYEYRKKFSSLEISENIKKKKPELLSDIQKISASTESKEKILKTIKKDQDNDRMAELLNILIADAESMDDEERQYWHDIMGSMTFEQKYKLMVILSTERLKLAELEIKYIKEIKSLNKKHLKEYHEFQKKKLQKKGNIKEIKLIDIKRHTLVDPTIDNLRLAEIKTKELISLYPDFLDAYMYLIEVYNKYDEDRTYDAKILLEKSKNIFKNSDKYNTELGYVYIRLEEYESAYKHIKLAALNINDDAKLHRIFGWLAVKFHDKELARNVLEKSYNKNKNNGLFVSQYAYVLEQNGNIDESFKVLQEYVKSDNKPSSTVFHRLGFKHYKKNNYNKAVSYSKKSTRTYSKNYDGFLMESLSLIEGNNDIKLAIKALEKSFTAFNLRNNGKKHDLGEISLALSILYSEMNQLNNVINYSSAGVKHTYGCSKNYMIKRNWHKKMLSLLKKHRLSIGCP